MTEDVDQAVLDLSDDADFAMLVIRRAALKATEQAGRQAEAERKLIDATIVSRLGNAAAARGPQGFIVTAPVVQRREYTVPAMSYRVVRVRRRRKGRK